MNKIGTAVIGAGTFGTIHARAYAELEDCELLYVCDKNIEAAHELAVKYGAIPTTSLDEISSDDNVDAVSVATPDFAHLDAVLMMIAAGKHVICEKPLATKLEDARRIFFAAEKSKVLLMVDFHNRFNPPLLETKRRIETLGRPIHGSLRLSNPLTVPRDLLTWSAQSGPEWFLLPHVIDLARWYTESEAVAVSACVRKGVLKEMGIDAIDYVQALVEFPTGSIAVESSWVLPESWPSLIEFDGQIVCENGRAAFSLHNQGVTVHSQAGSKHPFLAGAYDAWGYDTGFFHLPIRHFITCLRDNKLPVTNGRAGLMTTMTIESILRSAAEGRRVELAELMLPSELELEKMEEDQALLD